MRPLAAGRSPRAARQEVAELYEEHVWAVYGFFGYRVRSRADAEDLTQLTFERALRAWGRFDPDRASARTWLISIASNLLIDHYRRTARSAGADRGSSLAAGAGHRGRGCRAVAGARRGARGAGERERELIALRFGGELTGPEIADLTGLSLANVQQILSRSLRKVRAKLEGAA